MADKIVQLTDDANNNIYPVAGSLKSGSVTTNTIEDEAVTADKIDFSTLTILSGNTDNVTLSAGTWLVFAGCEALTSKNSGSFATLLSWFGTTYNFQGYRTSNENRNEGCFSWRVKLTIDQQTTYTLAKSGDAAETWSFNWIAIKLG